MNKNLSNQKRRVGRPPKDVKDYSVRVFTTANPDLKRRIMESGFSVSYILEYGAKVLLGDDREKELMEIERELSVLKPKVSLLESRRDLIVAEKRRIEALAKQRENEIKYLYAAFSQILKLTDPEVRKVTFKTEWMRQKYGIEFNISRVNEDFAAAISDLVYPAEYVVEKYQIRKVARGEREEKIMVEIIDLPKEEGEEKWKQ